jgi:hypothetical protein
MLISLSGGCDSRAIATFLSRNAGARWRCFTGGSPEAAYLPQSDVSIANRVAASLGLEQTRVFDEPAAQPVDELITSFVLNGEGRHDHMLSLTGTSHLRTLRASGVDGLVRGDEALGWKRVPSTDLAVRRSLHLLLCGDIAGLRPHLRAFGLEGHDLPAELRRLPEESIQTWCDRLYIRFRVPTLLAALNEHKAGYLDVVNPLLSRRVLEVARSLPDDLRTDKSLFRALVARIGPDLPFADRGGKQVDSLHGAGVRRLLRASLASDTAHRSFGGPLVAWLDSEIRPARETATRAFRAISRRVDSYLPITREDTAGVGVPALRLAFRVHVASTMIDLLAADATRFTMVSSAVAA